MKFRLNGKYFDLELKELTKEEFEELSKEQDFEKFSVLRYEDFMSDKYENDEEVNGYEFHRFSVYINSKLAGIVFADDVSDYVEFRNFVGGGFIKSSYSGIGIYGMCLDLMSLMLDINNLYLIILDSNISSIKGSKSFSICNKTERETLNDIDEYIEDDKELSNYILLKKQYK